MAHITTKKRVPREIGRNKRIITGKSGGVNSSASIGGGDGGVGTSTLADLLDTDISSPANWNLLRYDFASKKWKNTKDLHVYGNIYQHGSVYETHAEKLYTKKDEIILRDGNADGLLNGMYTGLRAKMYNGAHDGLLVFDNQGIARVGDEGSLQPLLTRQESPGNGQALVWNNSSKRAETVSKVPDSDKLDGLHASSFLQWALSTGTKLAPEFTGSTQKRAINFAQVSGSNDPGAIIHETASDSNNNNKGVLHLCPSDDNAYRTGGQVDYVAVHGTNDPVTTRFYTDGHIYTPSNLSIGSSSADKHLQLNRNGYNYICAAGGSDGILAFVTGNRDVSGANSTLTLYADHTAVFRDVLRGYGAFSSGFAGSNWQLNPDDSGDSHLTVDRLTVRGRMDIYELVVNRIRMTNGNVMITDSGKTYSYTTISGGYRITLNKDVSATPFNIDDKIIGQVFDSPNVHQFKGRVTATNSSARTFDVQTISGSMWSGAELGRINNYTDSDRKGYILLSAVGSGTPFIDTIYDEKVRLRTGKLSGISGQSGYGIWGSHNGTDTDFVISSGVGGSGAYAKIASFNLNHYAEWVGNNGRWIGLNTNTASKPDGSNRLGFGISIYLDDGVVGTNGLKLFRAGAITDKNTTQTWGSKYGIQLQYKYGGNYRDIFRVDQDGALFANWNFNSYAMWNIIGGGTGKEMYLSNSETSYVNTVHRRGLTIYNRDTHVPNGGMKAVQVGMLPAKDTISNYPSTPDYGFRLLQQISGGNYKDIFRADKNGAIIAGFSFDDSAIWTPYIRLRSVHGAGSLFLMGETGTRNGLYFKHSDGNYKYTDGIFMRFVDSLSADMEIANGSGKIDIYASGGVNFGQYHTTTFQGKANFQGGIQLTGHLTYGAGSTNSSTPTLLDCSNMNTFYLNGTNNAQYRFYKFTGQVHGQKLHVVNCNNNSSSRVYVENSLFHYINAGGGATLMWIQTPIYDGGTLVTSSGRWIMVGFHDQDW